VVPAFNDVQARLDSIERSDQAGDRCAQIIGCVSPECLLGSRDRFMGIGAARAGFGCGGLSGARARIVRQEKKKGPQWPD